MIRENKGCWLLLIGFFAAICILSYSIVLTSIIISILIIWLIGYLCYKEWKNSIRFASTKKEKVISLVRHIVYFIIILLILLFLGYHSGEGADDYDYIDYMMDKAR